VHYVEAGVADAAPLLLIHGGHGCWAHWIANIDALARQLRVIALDLPGFGESADPGALPDVVDFAVCVRALIEQLQLRNITLVGFSFGTLVAVTVAVAEPNRVVSLVLVNPPGVGDRTAAALALPRRLSELAKEHGLRAGVTGTLKEMMLCNHELINDELISLIANCVRRTRYPTRQISRQSQLIPILENVRQRTLVIFGGNDPFHCHDLEGRSELVNRALGAKVTKIIPSAAHWVQYDRPDQFNQTLLEFAILNTLAPTSGELQSTLFAQTPLNRS
jgi:2-hydroxy-6-oxonona-2,4-dienedioate hydrolase